MYSLLAFDSSTNQLTVGVQHAGGEKLTYQGEGGSLASPRLIGICLDLLKQAKLTLGELDAIVVGVGPGAFTGLRAACAVGQGFAFSNNVPVLPMSSLDILLEQGRQHWNMPDVENNQSIAVLDARMQQLYVHVNGGNMGEMQLIDYAQWQPDSTAKVIGNVSKPFADVGLGLPVMHDYLDATPQAQAMLALASARLQSGTANLLEAAQLAPVYVRNKVAQTTAERLAAKG